jgi:recombination protein RecR
MYFPDKLNSLTEALSTLPGIGPKAAERLAIYLLDQTDNYVENITNNLLEAKKSIHLCKKCNNFSEKEFCDICLDKNRNSSLLCVVEKIQDLVAIEKTGTFKGYYFVLHGLIDPSAHIGPDDLKIGILEKMCATEEIAEAILAFSPNFNGEITSLYISRVIGDKVKKLSKLAIGLPKGSDIEFTDSLTLGQAIEKRIDL